jgi:hypothetical protein
MSNWQTLSLNDLIPNEIRDAAAVVSTVTGTLNDFLTTVKSVLNVSKEVAGLIAGNPLETTLNLLLNEIDKLLEGLTAKSIGINLIAIPIQKQFYGPGARTPSDIAVSSNIPRFFQLLDSGAFKNRNPKTVPLEVVNFIDSASSATGGNQGFWKTLMMSIQDEGDINRPLYDEDSAVVGACLIFGAQDLTTLLPNFALFNSLIQTGERSDLSAHSTPAPPTISAISFGGSSAGSNGAVALSWPSLPTVTNASLFGGSQFVIVEIFVIRSTSASFRNKFSWVDVFSMQPSSVITNLPETADTKVIARIRNDGFVTGYVDADAALVTGGVYYYATAIRYTVKDVVQPMSNFSNCVRVDTLPRIQSRKSVPPDWFSSPSVLKVFPALEDVITEVRVAVATLRTRAVSTSGLLATILQTIKQIESIVKQLELTVQNIDSINSRIIALTSMSVAAVSATLISVDSGGINTWMAQLAKRLSDTSDPTRPPFNTGSELVAGIVIVAGAPNLQDLAAVSTLLSLFFGGGGDNPLLAAINSIEMQTASQAPVSFDETMSASRGTTVSEPVPVGFDAAMLPSTNPVC